MVQLTERIQLQDFTGQPCKSRIAFEFIPKAKHELDLEAIAKKLPGHEIRVEVETSFLLMLVVEGHNVSLFKSGKMIVKDTNDAKTGREIAQLILDKIQ